MTDSLFTPHHINATSDDFAGNNGIGRYILLPGSDGRAKDIASRFDNLITKQHPRGHHLYLGTIDSDKGFIDVAAIASGMGCPSMEIILHELFHLGAKRFLRVGTSGSLQAKRVKLGDIVNAQASVRDEKTTCDYVPINVPAIASFEMTTAVALAYKKLQRPYSLHTGPVHCKSSFYAREFGAGPRRDKNMTYINMLTQCGILATEMETASLFIQSQLYNQQCQQAGKGPSHQVLAGAILGIIAVTPDQLVTLDEETPIIHDLITLGLETIRTLASSER